MSNLKSTINIQYKV